jgi:fumarate reductase subunit C
MVNPTEYLPRTYHVRVSTYWWLARWRYFKFILREASSVFVAWTVILTLLGVRALTRGPAEYARFEQWLRSPPVVALNVIAFFFVFFHAVTWFNLTPKAMPIRVNGKGLPGTAVAAPGYAAWVIVSAIVAWIVLRG